MSDMKIWKNIIVNATKVAESNDIEDANHTDHEVSMAKSQLLSSVKSAVRIGKHVNTLSETEGLEGWVASKLTMAEDYLQVVADHMDGKKLSEGYKVLPPMDKEKYQARSGLEGPFSTLSGKVVYYDPREGKYYDPDTDMYISYEDFQKLDNDYSGMKDERDEVKEAGGYYTQPVYDMIKQHGYPKVMHRLLSALDADVIQDFISREPDLNESEKRWKQTSMSPQEAIAKYGKENVKVKKGALRNGDDMVEVFVESYSPGDEYADGMVSNCCGAPIMDYNDGFGRCSDCKEMASGEKEEEYYESTASGTYANVYYDYSEGFYMIDVYKDGKKVEEYDDYMGAMEEGNPIKDKFLELVKKAGLEPEGLPLVSTGGDEPDETGVFKNGKFNWHKSSSVSEGPFKGIGKQLMKRKLNKQYKKSDLANFDKSGIDTSGKTPEEIGQMKSDFYHDHMDKAARAKKAGDRLSGKKKVKESTQALTEEQFDEAAGEKDACYHKVKSRYKVWPSAYASGALVKCRKVGAKNWGNSKK